MAHLTPEIYEGEYYTVEVKGRTAVFTDRADAVRFAENVSIPNCGLVPSYEQRSKYVTFSSYDGVIGRLSADGYLDCTEWVEYDNEADAKAELFDETDGYAVFTLPARFASALINNDWSSSELTSWDSLSIGKFIEDENIISFIDVIDDEPHFAKLNDLSQEGDSVIRYLARIDESAIV